jgi:hypothetical protein
VSADVASWGGTAGPAYRAWATQQRQGLDGLAKASDAMALITEGAGLLIATVRVMVRDAIPTLVSRLITYAAEEAASLGFATPWVVEQVTTLCASWAGKMARWLKALLSSLRRLRSVITKLGELIEELKKILNRLRRKPETGKLPEDGKPPRSKYDQLPDSDLTANRGANIGRPGSGPKVREVRTEAELQEYFDALNRN